MTVTVVGRFTGVESVGKVTPREKVALEFSLPARLRFDPADLERFVSALHIDWLHLPSGLAPSRTGLVAELVRPGQTIRRLEYGGQAG